MNNALFAKKCEKVFINDVHTSDEISDTVIDKWLSSPAERKDERGGSDWDAKCRVEKACLFLIYDI